MVFCYQNCSDLLWEKIVLVIEKFWDHWNNLFRQWKVITIFGTSKSLSESLIFASTNPQYDNRLFMGLQVQYMKFPSSEHDENMLRTCCLHKLFLMSKQKQKTIYVSNMFLRCSQHVLIRELSCTELVIPWTIRRHVMG